MNPHDRLWPLDFKSNVSTNSTTWAKNFAKLVHFSTTKKPPGGGFFLLSGKRGSNPRPQPWQGCALPLSYFRLSLCACKSSIFSANTKNKLSHKLQLFQGTYFFRYFLISFSLFNASTGVRLSTSRPAISSRICFNTGSSSW